MNEYRKQHVFNKMPWKNRQEEEIGKAAQHAFQVFTRQQPRWEQSLFDEHFLSTRVIPWIAASTEKHIPLQPADLARAWAEQFTPASMVRAETILQAAPVMEDFLSLYEAEYTK